MNENKAFQLKKIDNHPNAVTMYIEGPKGEKIEKQVTHQAFVQWLYDNDILPGYFEYDNGTIFKTDKKGRVYIREILDAYDYVAGEFDHKPGEKYPVKYLYLQYFSLNADQFINDLCKPAPVIPEPQDAESWYMEQSEYFNAITKQ